MLADKGKRKPTDLQVGSKVSDNLNSLCIHFLICTWDL